MSDSTTNIPQFDGTSKVDFHTYKRSFKAVAMIKQFDKAIEQSLLIANNLAFSYADNL